MDWEREETVAYFTGKDKNLIVYIQNILKNYCSQDSLIDEIKDNYPIEN